MARVDTKVLQIMPKLQILLDNGNVTLNNNHKRKRFRLLNFSLAAILDFIASLRCLCYWKTDVLVFETIGQGSDVIKSKMAAREKLKAIIVSICLLRSLSEAATLFLNDRVGPGRFRICDLSRSDFFRWRWFWVAAVRWISGSSFRIVRAQPTWSPTDLLFFPADRDTQEFFLMPSE